MRERATALGGRLEIRPGIGGGTVVALWIPQRRLKNA
jgi:signal transduction histidine kinase